MRLLNLASAALVILTGCNKKKVEIPQGNTGVVAPGNDVPAVTNVQDVKSTTADGDSSATSDATELRKTKKEGKGEKEVAESVEESEETTDVESVGSTSTAKKNKISFDDLPVRGVLTEHKALSVAEKEAQLADINKKLHLLLLKVRSDLKLLDEEHEATVLRTLGPIDKELGEANRQMEAYEEQKKVLHRASYSGSEEYQRRLTEWRQIGLKQLHLRETIESLVQRHGETERELEKSHNQSGGEIARKYFTEKEHLLARQQELTALPDGAVKGRKPWVK